MTIKQFPNLPSKKSPLSLFLAIFATFLITNVISPTNIQAATFPISSSPVGTVITLGGQKFVKINNAGMFVGLQQFRLPGSATGMSMQNFTTSDCDTFHTPTGSNYTLVGVLIDSRDAKTYEVRKFSDGKCWMVDNLRYGGGTNGNGDYCAGKTVTRSADSLANSTATTTNGLNPPSGPATLVGDCRDAAAGSTSAPCQGTTNCGYYYNWPAAMQDQNAWQGNPSYVQPAQPTTGLCPQGWHLPSSGFSGEFNTLFTSIGSLQTGFFQPGGNFKSLYSGNSNNTGALSYQGIYGYFWSSTQDSATYAYSLGFSTSTIYPHYSNYKDSGFLVRCLKN